MREEMMDGWMGGELEHGKNNILPDGSKLYEDTITGPTSYPAGGFKINLPLSMVFADSIKVYIIKPLLVNDYDHEIEVVLPTATEPNAITIKVHRINVTGTSPVAWAEVPAATNLSALELTISVQGL